MYIGLAVGVFILCSIVQAIVGNSSMFSTAFETNGDPISRALVQLTFWPGWLATLGLALKGLSSFFAND